MKMGTIAATIAGSISNGGGLVVVNADGSIAVTPATGKGLTVGVATTSDIPTLRLPGYSGADWRIHRHTATDGGGHQDNVIGFTYNSIWTSAGASGSWTAVDTSAEPQLQMSYESYWNGNFEWNLDAAPAGAAPGATWRPFGFQGTYATQDINASIGYTNTTCSGGIQVNAGATNGYLWVRALDTQVAGSYPIFELRHGLSGADKVYFKVHPTQYASVISAAGNDVSTAGWNGLMRIMDSTLSLAIGGTAATDTAFLTQIDKAGTQDANPRLICRTDGHLAWGPGTATQDTTLYRSAAGLLKSDNTLQAAQGIVTIAVAGAVSDASFTTAPPIGTLAVDSTGNLYAKTAAATWAKTSVSTGAGSVLVNTDGSISLTPASGTGVTLGVAPPATANRALMQVGNAPIDGTSAGHYTGNASGGGYGANFASGYAGDLINLQIAGSSKFSVDSTGSILVGNIINARNGLSSFAGFTTSAAGSSIQFRGVSGQTADIFQAQDNAAHPQFAVANVGSGASPIWVLRVRAVANAESMVQSHTAGAATGRAIQIIDDAGVSLGWLNLTA